MYDRQKNLRGGKQAQKVSHVTIRLLTAPTNMSSYMTLYKACKVLWIKTEDVKCALFCWL